MKYLSFLSIFALLLSCKNNTGSDASAISRPATDSVNFTNVLWPDSVQNIGTLKYGETAQVKFHFRNTGSKPLFIISAEPGCGCTVADYPKGAIAPGAEGEIVAVFKTENQHEGRFDKSISVNTNSLDNYQILIFSGEIKKDGKQNAEVPAPVPSQDSATKKN